MAGARNRKERATIPMPADSLEGLGEKWELCDSVRRRVCWEDDLLVWLNPERVGVPSFDIAGANFDALLPFFTLWASKVDVPRAPRVAVIETEAHVL